MYITDNALDNKIHRVRTGGKFCCYVQEPCGFLWGPPFMDKILKVKNWCKGKKSAAALALIKEKGWIYEIVPRVYDETKGASHPTNYGIAIWPTTLLIEDQSIMRRVARAGLFGMDCTMPD